jgi:NTP pyrophosphatase (non-canonical NTP hydrolase)
MNITSDNYVEYVLKTESCDWEIISERLQNKSILRLLHAVIGLCTETGELADILKKHIFYGKELDWMHVVEESGDLSWYSAVIWHLTEIVKGIKMNDGLQLNIEKLQKRYPNKFSEERALNR